MIGNLFDMMHDERKRLCFETETKTNSLTWRTPTPAASWKYEEEKSEDIPPPNKNIYKRKANQRPTNPQLFYVQREFEGKNTVTNYLRSYKHLKNENNHLSPRIKTWLSRDPASSIISVPIAPPQHPILLTGPLRD